MSPTTHRAACPGYRSHAVLALLALLGASWSWPGLPDPGTGGRPFGCAPGIRRSPDGWCCVRARSAAFHYSVLLDGTLLLVPCSSRSVCCSADALRNGPARPYFGPTHGAHRSLRPEADAADPLRDFRREFSSPT